MSKKYFSKTLVVKLLTSPQGKKNLQKALLQNDDHYEDIKAEILEIMSLESIDEGINLINELIRENLSSNNYYQTF
jgi:hypothetical protein